MRDWPLTGRDADITAILAARARPGCAGVVVAGAAGLGKTRLAREAARRLGNVTWVRATRAAASIPFGAVAHLAAPGTRPLDLVRAAAEWAAARERPVLGVDDAHLLDEGSAAVVAHLVTTGLVFVVLTVRTGEARSDAVTGLWKDGLCERLDLTRLSEEDIDGLLRAELELDGEVTLEAAAREFAHRAADGNPLALRELLSAGRSTGVLTRRFGVWRWTGPLRAPAEVAELIAANLRELSEGVRAAVELVACGEPLPAATLTALAEPDAVDEAVERGLITVERRGSRHSVRIAHPLYGELVRAVLPPLRAAAIWRSLASAALDAPLRRHDDTLRAALWQVDGGLILRPDIVLRGAQQAVGRSDLVLAERLARAARRAAPGPESDRVLGEILEYRGAEAGTLLPEEPPDEERGPWAVARASTLYWGAGRVADTHAALDLAGGDDLAESTRVWILLFDGRCAEAAALARRVLARPDVHPQAAIWAAACGSSALAFTGEHAASRAMRERGTALAEALHAQLPWGVVQMGFGACFAALAGGDLAEGWAVAEAGHRRAVADRTPLMAGGFAAFRGLIENARGVYGRSDATLREAVAILEDNDTFRFVRGCLTALAESAAVTGRPGTADEWAARAAAMPGGWNRLLEPWRLLSRAWLAHAHGENPLPHAASALALARELGLPTVEAQAAYATVRLGGTVRELPDAGDAPLPPVLAAAREALAGDDPAALTGAADGFARLGMPLHAAELHATAARRLRGGGRRAAAALASERAAALRAECGDVRTPLLAEDAAVLSRREREIALLAVKLRSKEIAAELGLSVNTVHNNLARAYVKLGVSGRDELRRLWAERGW
ncbi:LuxR family transcriptional regulator [Actinorhabdospora filicis]|uniref:LuxR family transcriptional regulator n=1 Tax=Actinorhabdospora filicis TaxID=1785913 RepID=A0A9W6SK37_9ACTN|nr:LuxR family transcriptional regulator [Actinorhabdospora filicis]GLZ77385.1 LuxR family transcriptional regulator [Actinorhabdospora filicis]